MVNFDFRKKLCLVSCKIAGALHPAQKSEIQVGQKRRIEGALHERELKELKMELVQKEELHKVSLFKMELVHKVVGGAPAQGAQGLLGQYHLHLDICATHSAVVRRLTFF